MSVLLLSSCTTYKIEIPNNTGESLEDKNAKDLKKEERANKEDGDKEGEEKEEDIDKESIEVSDKLVEMENEMVDLVNKEREENNLNKLELDEELRNVARIKSKDIAENNYFDHTSPSYGSPFEMMERFGIDFFQAAENLAGHQSVKQAHEGLMDSKGHRENILRSGLTHIGIGIVKDDEYKFIFTQMFIAR